jgi:hypothetical protein
MTTIMLPRDERARATVPCGAGKSAGGTAAAVSERTLPVMPHAFGTILREDQHARKDGPA